MKHTMKKITAAALAAIMMVGTSAMGTICAGSGTACAEAAVGMANPWRELESLEELNTAAYMNLQLPGVMGVTDVHYRLMANAELPLAELQFRVNGYSYVLRASGNVEEDISGVYLDDGKTAFEDYADISDRIVVTKTMKLARWFNTDGQYVLIVEDEGAYDEETFKGIVSEMMDLTNPAQMGELTSGMYYDATSQRAYAYVEAMDGGAYAIEIHWSSSAWEDNVWTMTAEFTEDGLLSYNDCVEMLVVTDDNGNENVQEANIIPDGYFMPISSTSFTWEGAAEENCRSCVFELAAK